MNAQLLFDYNDPIAGRARKRDRKSAKDAAKSMAGDVLRAQQRDVLSVVVACQHGATAYECAVQLGRQQNVMASRLSELGELGLLFRREGTFVSRDRVEVVFESRAGGSGRKC